jgi:hypothetical protein
MRIKIFDVMRIKQPNRIKDNFEVTSSTVFSGFIF